MHILEPIFSHLRLRQAINHIKPGSTVCDIGCGNPSRLLDKIQPIIKHGIGLDLDVPSTKAKNLSYKKIDFENQKLPLKSGSVDTVVLLAVIEHVKNPTKLLSECNRVLQKGGSIILTTPSPESKHILNILSFVKLLYPKMINQHKNYFSLNDLKILLIKTNFQIKKANTFEWGFNCFALAAK